MIKWKSKEMKEHIIKILRNNKLSKVYLIRVGDKSFIKKVVHKDFIDQFYKQKYLSERCKKVKIPMVITINKKKCSCIMEYIPHKENNLLLKEVLDILYDFHNDIKKCPSGFLVYDFNHFYKDCDRIKKYLPREVANLSKSKMRVLFCEVFNSKFSVIHGDFHKNQVFKSGGKRYMIDFAGSFYGPKILDYAYYFREHNKVNPSVYNYIEKSIDKERFFRKALVAVLIFDLNWLLNRLQYEQWPSKKMKKIVRLIKLNFDKLNI